MIQLFIIKSACTESELQFKVRTERFEFWVRFVRNKCSFVAHKSCTVDRAYPHMSLIKSNIKSHAKIFPNQFLFFFVQIDDRLLSKVLMIFSVASFNSDEIILLNKDRNDYFPFEDINEIEFIKGNNFDFVIFFSLLIVYCFNLNPNSVNTNVLVRCMPIMKTL